MDKSMENTMLFLILNFANILIARNLVDKLGKTVVKLVHKLERTYFMKLKTISIIMILALIMTCFAPVYAFADDENTTENTEITASETITSLSAPTGVKAKATGKTSIKVTWKEVEGADGYKVYRYSREKDKYVLVKTTSSTSYKDTGLRPNRTKAYKVKAYANVGGKKISSKKSSKAKATTDPRTIKVKAYAYTGGGYTASGMKAQPGVIAVDRSVIKLGTKVYVPGYGYATAADTGGMIKGNTIDCYMSSTSQCYAWGVRYVTIKIYD